MNIETLIALDYLAYHGTPPEGMTTCDLAAKAALELRQQQGQGEPIKTILRDETSAWQTQTTSDGHPCVTCHTKLVGGVLCRWWGDGPIPSGVAMLDSLTSPPAPQAGMVLVPIEPTDAMLTAGGLALGNHIKALVAKDPQQALNAKGKPRGLVIGWKEKMAIRYKAVIVAAKEK